MEVKLAKLIDGTEQDAGDGITGAKRCVIQLPDSNLVGAVLKRGPLEEVSTECFSALLLREWGLPVPDPYLIDESGQIAFASADVGYPNLKQALGYSSSLNPAAIEQLRTRAIDVLFGLSSTHLALACDEAINNRDRNLGNVLWDGSSESWIDHARSLRCGVGFPDENILCALAKGTPHENDVQRGGVARALMLDRSMPNTIESHFPSTPIEAFRGATLVADRLARLGELILERFPKPEDLLASQPL